jgi:AcrR family transcriptional regulator
MNAKSAEVAPRPAAEVMLGRIMQGAHECFQRYGIDKTTMEDIARQAGVARQTIYKHVASKDEIVQCIARNETTRINAEVRQRLKKGDSFADTLTETLFIVVKVAKSNVCVRYILGSATYLNRPDQNVADVQHRHHDLWENTLQAARASHELAEDISVAQVVYWLTVAQTMLLYQGDHLPKGDDQLRSFIRRFVVDPLLARSRAG